MYSVIIKNSDSIFKAGPEGVKESSINIGWRYTRKNELGKKILEQNLGLLPT
jgi:hypothetical protein